MLMEFANDKEISLFCSNLNDRACLFYFILPCGGLNLPFQRWIICSVLQCVTGINLFSFVLVKKRLIFAIPEECNFFAIFLMPDKKPYITVLWRAASSNKRMRIKSVPICKDQYGPKYVFLRKTDRLSSCLIVTHLCHLSEQPICLVHHINRKFICSAL